MQTRGRAGAAFVSEGPLGSSVKREPPCHAVVTLGGSRDRSRLLREPRREPPPLMAETDRVGGQTFRPGLVDTIATRARPDARTTGPDRAGSREDHSARASMASDRRVWRVRVLREWVAAARAKRRSSRREPGIAQPAVELPKAVTMPASWAADTRSPGMALDGRRVTAAIRSGSTLGTRAASSRPFASCSVSVSCV